MAHVNGLHIQAEFWWSDGYPALPTLGGIFCVCIYVYHIFPHLDKPMMGC